MRYFLSVNLRQSRNNAKTPEKPWFFGCLIFDVKTDNYLLLNFLLPPKPDFTGFYLFLLLVCYLRTTVNYFII